MSNVFSPFRFNSQVVIKNRLAVAPMTTQQSNYDGTISQNEDDWLERLANDGYGIVISCAAAISNTSIAFHNQLNISSEGMAESLSRLAQRMKMYNSVNIIQLCHGGARTMKSLTAVKPCSASSYTMDMITGFEPPETLSQKQIDEIINDFANACKIVANAGFHGVELHGANGYLFTQFLSKMTNLRNDKYGGDVMKRALFAREVIQACRKVVPKDFIIGFRISFENMGLETGLDIDDNIRIINVLAEDGIDYVHTSHMNYAAKTIKYPEVIALQYLRTNITKSLPLIGVGEINSIEDAEKAIEYGADIVAVGRAAIGNKQLPTFFEERKPLLMHTPYSEKYLIETGISSNFIDYLKNSVPLASLNIVDK